MSHNLHGVVVVQCLHLALGRMPIMGVPDKPVRVWVGGLFLSFLPSPGKASLSSVPLLSR